ncbi:esterase/lipase family protein [Paludifilum halophilum]|uniref:Alpha/beta hydrolase n=1 Tax=Paludifilum halophilum TaxID=1642702 RepID=A0A235B5E7_9BACL|nr:hypothetical protein [Paludifilum halophilum]OYD07513.1 hypothetical protein CHM34_11505 [Paludifilum halophilum]
MRRGFWVMMVVFLSMAMVFPSGWIQAEKDVGSPPPPKPMGKWVPEDPAGTPGTWFLGAEPSSTEDKPPVVFVQGLHGQAQSWYEDTEYYGINDMYEYAYNHGYRTAFVQLHDAGGEAADMYDNGELLAGMLEEISAHFGEPVNIVAHSKGGVDSQAALIHSGAWLHVGRVVTLASPHRGSHLADLAYSSWAGWLAELLGARDPGTESLQTGSMEQFRSVTDSHPDAEKNTYITTAGTSWGPFPSALWTGGAYLSAYGENDGLVNLWSTSLPYGHHLFTADYDHDQIRLGRTSFPRIEPYLKTTDKLSSDADRSEEVAAAAMEEFAGEPERIVNGGPLEAGKLVEQSIPVNSGEQEAVFSVMTDNAEDRVVLVSPSGRTYNPESREYFRGKDSQIFSGAHVQAFRIDQPEAGDWNIRITSSEGGAYLLTTTFTGANSVQLQLNPPNRSGEKVPVRLKMKDPQRWQLDRFDVQMRVVPPETGKTEATEEKMYRGRLTPSQKEETGVFTGELPALKDSGVYNLTLDIRGMTRKGESFRRTVIQSFYVPDRD